MEQQRERARRGAGPVADRHEAVIAFVGAAPPTRLRRLRALEPRPASPPPSARWRRRGARQARGEPVLRRGRRPGRRFRRDRPGTAARRGRRRLPRRRRPGAPRRRGPGPDAGAAVEAGRRPRVRHATMRNHTATHLLHAALRERARHPRAPGGLRGAPGQAALRLHPRPPLDPDELREIEDRVNDWIKASRPVRALEMERAEAEAMGRWRCSARSTATGSGGRGRRRLARALRRDHVANTAERSGSSRSSPRARAPPTCAGSRR